MSDGLILNLEAVRVNDCRHITDNVGSRSPVGGSGVINTHGSSIAIQQISSGNISLTSLVGISTATSADFTGHDNGSITVDSSMIDGHLPRSIAILTAPGRIPRIQRSVLARCLKGEMDFGNLFLRQLESGEDTTHCMRLNDSAIHRLQESYFARVNPWFPVLDECVSWPEHLARAEASNFGHECPSTGLVLLALSLGNIAEEGTRPATNLESLQGFLLFKRAYQLVAKRNFQTDLTIIQCFILMAQFYMYNLRRLLALDIIVQAARKCLLLHRIQHEATDLDVRLLIRASWCCHIPEAELNTHLRFEGSGIAFYTESLPLPSPEPGEENFQFFLALVSICRIRDATQNSLRDKGSNEIVHAPIVSVELESQLEQWYSCLPPPLKFPKDKSRIMHNHRSFLRLQYHCLKTVLYWPAISQCLQLFVHSIEDQTEPPQSPHEPIEAGRAREFVASLVIGMAEMKVRNRTQYTWTMCQG
ncbi:hypothetical protein K4K59_008616 [Colletotrichum sp. SAR11_240]|nr:hypothetical protein K4K59_008616 [Colletotrichum sp. SAR11_240]